METPEKLIRTGNNFGGLFLIPSCIKMFSVAEFIEKFKTLNKKVRRVWSFFADLAAMTLSCRQAAFRSGTFSYDRENTRV